MHRDPEGGAVIVNPHDLRAVIANSDRGAASAVIAGDDIAISTISCSSHEDTAGHAGFGLPWYDCESLSGDPRCGMLRLGADANGITLELWPWRDGPECPYDEADLKALLEFVRGHPRLSRLVAKGYETDIAIHDSEGVLAWTFSDAGVEFAGTPPVAAPGQ